MLNLFHTPMFEESLRGAEGLLRKREMASEGRERGSQSQREERTTNRLCHREGRRMSAGTPEIFRVREEAPGAGLGLPLSLSPTSETDLRCALCNWILIRARLKTSVKALLLPYPPT